MISINDISTDFIKRYSGSSNTVNSPYLSNDINGFSLVDTLGSLVNNYEWKQGYVDLYNGKNTNESYIWKCLSAIGQDVSEELYQQVLNYIDNAANIDLCKIKVLKSYIKMIGVNYQLFDNIDSIPLEILNLLDILSINKKYLTSNQYFNNYFLDILSSNGVTEQSVTYVTAENLSATSLSSDLSASFLSTVTITDGSMIFNEGKYEEILKTIYRKVLNKFVLLKYADFENGLENIETKTKQGYIWKYLLNKLVFSEQIYNSENTSDTYDTQIKDVKLKYNIVDFDEAAIVDNIENNLDSLSNYSEIEQDILEIEYARRNNSYIGLKTYEADLGKNNKAEKSALAANLTRYSWYREQKVIDYVTFCETQYNQFIIESNAGSILNSENDAIDITVYDNDNQYFNINQQTKNYLISYDESADDYYINQYVINELAILLAKQTLQIADLREQLKIQAQKTYLKGTFFLLSYMINDYLLNNVGIKYRSISDPATGTTLYDLINKSVNSGANINLVEYLDSTEYFNISTETSPLGVNSDQVNLRYWETGNNCLSNVSKELAISEISNFYYETLKTKLYNIDTKDNVIDFLSVVFNLGANSTYAQDDLSTITTSTNELSIKANELLSSDRSQLRKDRENLSNFISNDISVGLDLSLSTSTVENQLSGEISSWVSSDIKTVLADLAEGLEISSTYQSISSIVKELSTTYRQINNQFNSLMTNLYYAPILSTISSNITATTLNGKIKQLIAETDKFTYNASSTINSTYQTIKNEAQTISVSYENAYLSFKEFCDQLQISTINTIIDPPEYVVESTTYSDKYSSDVSYDIDLGTLISHLDSNGKANLTDLQNQLIAADTKYIKSKLDIVNEMTARIKSMFDKYNAKYLEFTISILDAIDKLLSDIDTILSGSTSSTTEDMIEPTEMFKKYTGLSTIGETPYYNYKNQTHPSYQIHPYLYNFIRVSNFVYPIENLFYVTFTETYDAELSSRLQTDLSGLLGDFGELKNTILADIEDYSGYSTPYERSTNTIDYNDKQNLLIDNVDPFYKPALIDYLTNTEQFIAQLTAYNTIHNKYYEHLNISTKERERIGKQLEYYKDVISELTHVLSPTVTNIDEYDIYKYATDIYGNSIYLYKNYRYLYDKLEEDEVLIDTLEELEAITTLPRGTIRYVHYDKNGAEVFDKYVFNTTNVKHSATWELIGRYSPSYEDKKSTTGELWIKIKNHPIAFPAFNLVDIEHSHFDTEESKIDGYKLNDYIIEMNDYFKSTNQYSSLISGQYLNVFFDFEIDSYKKNILLNVPYKTGGSRTSRKTQQPYSHTYYNSDIIVGAISQKFDYAKNLNVYRFSANKSTDTNIDNIHNTQLRIANSSVFSDFIGFMPYNESIVCFYNNKYITTDNLIRFPDNTMTITAKVFRDGSSIIDASTVNTLAVSKNNGLLYNIDEVDASDIDINNYPHVVLSYDQDYNVVFSYVTKSYQEIEGVNVIGHPEYKNVIDEIANSEYGTVHEYGNATKSLQTVDRTKYIYNSFDSFLNYICVVDCVFKGRALTFKNIRYFNLNSSLGYIPVYNDSYGKTRFQLNSELSTNDGYLVELLGPERSDEFTTTYISNINIKNGRVVEEYQDLIKFDVQSEEITKPASDTSLTFSYDFEFVGELSAIAEMKVENQHTYKFVIYNTDYIGSPIFIADNLSNEADITNNYNRDDQDIYLSGEQLVGPTNETYIETNKSNHINNIANLSCGFKYNNGNIADGVSAVTIGGILKQLPEPVNGIRKLFREGKFQFTIYKELENTTYDDYHLFENRDTVFPINDTVANKIDFNDITGNLTDYTVNGMKPFANENPDAVNNGVTNYELASAKLEFKYDEELNVNDEFPLLDTVKIDYNISVTTNTNYYYYFTLDDFNTIDIDNIYLSVLTSNADNQTSFARIKMDTRSNKYRDFYDRALTIKTNYIVEHEYLQDNETIISSKIDLYFNYDNFENSPYKDVTYQISGQNYSVEVDADIDPTGTYLKLSPYESGILDIRVEYRWYANDGFDSTLVGQERRTIRRYQITNISDNKPKFLIKVIDF